MLRWLIGSILGEIICESSNWQHIQRLKITILGANWQLFRLERIAKYSYFILSTRNIKFTDLSWKIKKFMLPIWWCNRGWYPPGNKYLGPGVFVLNRLRHNFYVCMTLSGFVFNKAIKTKITIYRQELEGPRPSSSSYIWRFLQTRQPIHTWPGICRTCLGPYTCPWQFCWWLLGSRSFWFIFCMKIKTHISLRHLYSHSYKWSMNEWMVDMYTFNTPI